MEILPTLFLMVIAPDDDPLMSAILFRSTSKLGELLIAHDNLSATSFDIPQMSLHMYLRASIGWPDGMRIIIECMSTRGQLYRDSHCLCYAYYLKHWNSVDLLLQFGWEISYATVTWLFEFNSTGDDRALQQRLAQDIWQHQKTFRPQPKWPFPFTYDPVTAFGVFHLQLPIKAMSAFYDIGFRELDTEGYIHIGSTDSWYPTTPLWKLAQSVLERTHTGHTRVYDCVDEILARAHWLIDKGANITWSHPQFQTTPAHLLAIASFRKPHSHSVCSIFSLKGLFTDIPRSCESIP